MLFLLTFYFICVASSKVAEDDIYVGIEKYHEKYDLPKLKYSYDALEPWIDTLTMKTHHGVIYKQYTDKLNAVLKEWRGSKEEEKLSKTSLLNILSNIDAVPDKWRADVMNYGGGYLSHLFYFATLGGNPSGKEIEQLPVSLDGLFKRSFVNFTSFKTWFARDVCRQFGTGHAWLIRVPQGNYLTIYVTVEETTPLNYGYQPILVADFWEHAFFLKHQYKRENYIKNWWKVIDWYKVERLLKWWQQFDPKHDEL